VRSSAPVQANVLLQEDTIGIVDVNSLIRPESERTRAANCLRDRSVEVNRARRRRIEVKRLAASNRDISLNGNVQERPSCCN